MFRHGHYGIALLSSAPASLLVGQAIGLPFSLVVVATSMLPDWDTNTTRVRHRGPTHTLAFAVAVAAVLGTLAMAGWLALRTVAPAATTAPAVSAGAVVAAGSFVGVASHLVADALNSGVEPNAIRPFWPASRRVVRLGIAPVDSPTWNWGLLIAGALAQLAALLLAGGLG